MFSIVKYAVIASLSAVPADEDICCCFAFSVNAGEGNIVCEEGGVGEGRSRYVISPGGGNFECVSCPGWRGGGGGGGGASTVRFFWVYAACVSEPPLPHYI